MAEMDMGAKLFAQGISAGSNAKSQEDPAGKDNAHAELLTSAANGAMQALKYAIPIPGAGLITGAGSASMFQGLESPDGFASKNIMPSFSASGSDTFIGKLLRLLLKGGFMITDQTGGISPNQMVEGMSYGSGVDISPSLLGSLSPPSVGDMNISQGSGISYA